jgi:hypothetical protein
MASMAAGWSPEAGMSLMSLNAGIGGNSVAEKLNLDRKHQCTSRLRQASWPELDRAETRSR